MNFLKPLSGLIGGIVICAQLQAAPAITREMMNEDLDFVKNVFGARYAPKAWKRHYSGWSLEQEIHKAKSGVESQEAPSLKEYQRILSGFIQSTKDYHVGVRFHATEAAKLPIEIRSAKGKYFLAHVDRAKLSEGAFPFKVGDEVLSLGGRPIADVVKKLKELMGANTPETDQALAEYMITRRRAASALPVPRGPVTIELQPKDSQKRRTHQLIWDYTPEMVRGRGFSARLPFPGGDAFGRIESGAFTPVMMPGFAADLRHWRAEDQQNPHVIGEKKTFTPPLGAKIWESAESDKFHAYVFRSPAGKLIGYIRIPSYGAGAEEAKAFAEILKRFNDTTDGLVLDQVNNPGGSVFYLYALVSMLTDQTIVTPKHRMTLTQEDAAQGFQTVEELKDVKSDEDAKKKLGETIGGYPVNLQVARFFREFAQFYIDEWNEGKSLSDPYYLGIDQINPHPEVRYTKPILVLVNSLDFSGGDFFPAILQDNKRATIFGTRTAGAGGYVLSVNHPNHLGVAGFSVTGSIAERVDKNPIENLGVTPDIAYEMSETDLRDDYSEYKKAIVTAIEDLVK